MHPLIEEPGQPFRPYTATHQSFAIENPQKVAPPACRHHLAIEMEIAAPLLTVALVSGEELGRFRASSGEDLRRQLFAVPRRLTPLRRADPRSTQLVCKDGLVSEGQVFTEDSRCVIL